MEVALCLVNGNQQASFLANKDGISPLYLAVEAGDVSLVKEMLRNDGPFEGSNFNLEGKKYLAHAALKPMNTDILDVVLSKCPSLVDERDEEGKTCLSFGASMGYYEGVCKLLDRSIEGVFVCDDDGSYPSHVAVEKGHFAVVMEILKRCPYSTYLLNKKGQNILHIAAESGRYKIILHLASRRMAREQDVDGNTPLHLATIKWRPRAVLFLAGTNNLLIQNNSGLTALDVAELNLQPHYIFWERLTLLALADAHIKIDPRCSHTIKLTRPVMPAGGGNKDYANALLVVAALIATVTFTAGFTLPGGFKSSTPNLGMANLLTEPRFIFFLIFDIMALGSSLVAVIYLILAQLGDPVLYQSSIWMAMISLTMAVYFMSFTFTYALLIAAGNVTWLFCVIAILVSIVLLFWVKLFLPHVVLHGYGINYRVMRLFVVLLISFDDDGNGSYGTSL